ncbi:maltose phosphorylase [Erysipelothrix larvae]|uniref:Alpha-1,4 glucan phosphorylase n=1 Tax=Erysipelothrix larvae TaxID=1514105 RepID=A0A0X8GYE2_9FIRM|nr:glycogen/starch/alpha-glucan family phosphorylase [Erysipelothrix larvae]AMC92722.1 maltose phosphorylase [Erysipelothrix larvae]
MIREELLAITNNNIEEASLDALYQAVLSVTQKRIENMEHVHGDRTVYYMSAEFLIGKLLSNNMMNLGIYHEIAQTLKEHGRDISEVEGYDPEPSLGNGGLGRLAACFLDSIATLGINGEGLGLVYHFGLFKQVFENHMQVETKDVWLDKPSWLRKTDTVYSFKLSDVNVTSRMHEIDVLGYRGKKTTLRLFDLDSIDETLVTQGIDFDQSKVDSNLTLFLYPDDSTEQGLRLRFAQQYFMTMSNVSYIFDKHHDDIDHLYQSVVVQINDTHPAMSILLVIQRLMKHGKSFDEACSDVQKMFAYTNHTILAEALEKWPLSYFEAMDHELVVIIKKLQKKVDAVSKDPAVAILDKDKRVHMASLSIHFSYSTNGVASLHTDILVNSELKAFADLYPDRFNNKTNGITFRRWLQFSNPELTQYLIDKIGDGFLSEATQLRAFEAFKDDARVQEDVLRIKQERKDDLVSYIKKTEGIDVNPTSVFDIQIKRLHEYKRQQLNLLYIIHMMHEIREGHLPKRPVTFFFGSKAAPAYTIAKDIIHALLTLSSIIEKDPVVSQYLQIVFVENYNVSKAEHLIPAGDISEQISLASKEASGTGNMKLMLNGALTLGTLDGANVEIADLVGPENVFIFGKHSDTVIDLYATSGYNARHYYETNDNIKRAIDTLVSEEMLKEGTHENLSRLHHELISKDWFMTLLDFDDYVETKNRMLDAYEDRLHWAKMMIVNISNAGYFSSDRTIAQYADEIWKVNHE